MKPYPPLGILYIAAYLRSKGYEPAVFDSTFSTKAEFRSYVSEHRPEVVGFSSNLMTKLNVVELMKFCKSIGSMVVVGGPDVPEYADQYLRYGADAAVIGEGEETMAELLPLLASGGDLSSVGGIAFRNGSGSVVRTPPRALMQQLDSLPLPARDLIDVQRYIRTWRAHHGRGSLSVICARGCPLTSTRFSRSVIGATHRRRSAVCVVDEIESVMREYHPDMLWFADDVFTINHAWFNEFYDEMRRRGLSIPFECISRADRLNGEILRKMSELGCFRVWFGSESGSQQVLDAMERRVTAGKIRDVTKLAQRFGIEAGLFVMLGYPGERLADIEETVAHLKAADPDLFLTTVAYPIKGTDFYAGVAGSIELPADWSRSTDRQIRIKGRHSDTFYWYANRYIVNAVRAERLRTPTRRDILGAISASVKAAVARAGMRLTAHQQS